MAQALSTPPRGPLTTYNDLDAANTTVEFAHRETETSLHVVLEKIGQVELTPSYGHLHCVEPPVEATPGVDGRRAKHSLNVRRERQSMSVEVLLQHRTTIRSLSVQVRRSLTESLEP